MNEADLNKLNQLIIDHSIEGIIITDTDSNILKVNSAFCKISGYTDDEIIGKKANLFKSGKHPTGFYRQMWDALLDSGEWQGEIWNRRKNGEVYPGWLTIRTVRDELGKALNYLAIFSDICAWESHPEAVLIIDGDGYIFYVNQKAIEIFGFPDKAHFVGKYYGDLVGDTDREVVKERINFAMQGKSNGLLEGTIVRTDGQARYIERISVPVIFAGARRVQIILRDITSEKKWAEKLRQNERRFYQLAHYDQLTQLPNRASLGEQLPDLLITFQQNNKKVAVMYIGLSNTSLIANTYGTSIGNRLIQESVARIQENLGENDLLSRLSETEFVAILTFENNIQVIDIAEEIIQAFRTSFVVDGYEFHIHVNIGISTYINTRHSALNEMDVGAFIKDAYIAYRRTKEIGRNKFSVSSPEMNIKAKKTFTLQNDLYQAVEKGELELYYQPRVNPFTCQIMSAEALLRWNHPIFGVVTPGEFILLAEESDLILSIGEWVIREACKQNKEWQDTGINKIPISINVSGKQLMQKDFKDLVVGILRETKLEEEWMELEVTESTIFTNEEAMINTIAKLHELGVRISIDDFGTGHSTLCRLKHLKCHTVKVDQSFIRNIENPSDQIITEMIIKLSHTLGMNIVAEGVETIQQLQFLREKQCDEVQGYLFSRPIPGSDFEKFLRSGQVLNWEEYLPFENDVSNPQRTMVMVAKNYETIH